MGTMLANLVKFAVDSAADESFKGPTGVKKLYKTVQERVLDLRTSLSLNDQKKPASVNLVEEMQMKLEQSQEGAAKLKEESNTSANFMHGMQPPKKAPDEGIRGADHLEAKKKIIFIRSRL